MLLIQRTVNSNLMVLFRSENSCVHCIAKFNNQISISNQQCQVDWESSSFWCDAYSTNYVGRNHFQPKRKGTMTAPTIPPPHTPFHLS